MSLKIRYTSRAKLEEIKIIQYVFDNFGQSSALKVYRQMTKSIELIAKTPSIYPKSKKAIGVQKCVMNKHTSIYFKINGGFLDVLTFRANRKNPEDFKL